MKRAAICICFVLLASANIRARELTRDELFDAIEAAASRMEKSKDELVTIARSLGKTKDPANEEHDLLCTLVDNFEDVEECLNELAQLAHAARERQLSAAAPVALR